MAANIETLQKERDSLLFSLDSGQSDISKLQTYLADLNFQNLKEEPDNNWTAEVLLKKYSKNPLDCVKLRKPESPEHALKQLEQIIHSTENIILVTCKDLTCVNKDGKQHWEAKCSVSDSELRFNIRFSCKNLDAKQMKILNVTVENQKYISDLKTCIDACIKMNDIPLLIQNFLYYTKLKKDRNAFLDNIRGDFANNMILIQKNSDKDSAIITINLINPTSKKLLLKIKWAIVYSLVTMEFSFCLTLRSEPEGQWLRNDHADIIGNIVESTEVNQHTMEDWKALCGLVEAHAKNRLRKK